MFVCLFFAAFGSSKTEQDAQASLPITSMYALSPPLSKSPTTVVHLLQSVNLYRHIIITPNLYFIWGFTLGFYILWVFDKCILTYNHCFDIIQNSFAPLKFLCDLPIHPSPPPSRLLQLLNFLLLP